MHNKADPGESFKNKKTWRGEAKLILRGIE